MNFALCDDDEQELLKLYQLVLEYSKHHLEFETQIDCYHSVEELLKQQPKRYDLMLLDILMPKMNGIEYARLLRESGGQASIIFTTSSPNFALDAYLVGAIQYLLKPVTGKALHAALDQALLTIERQRAACFAVSTADGLRTLYCHDITYVECIRHFSNFHLSDGSVICSKTLRQSFVTYIMPLLADDRFIHTHHSFVVNMQYVIKLNQRDFELANGQIIPISKDRLTLVKSRYLKYLDQK